MSPCAPSRAAARRRAFLGERSRWAVSRSEFSSASEISATFSPLRRSITYGSRVSATRSHRLARLAAPPLLPPESRSRPYNVYRGQIATGVSFAYDHTCLNSEGPISGSSLADPVQPDSGSAFYYLVTRVDQCRESSAGPASDESPRPNDLPCPDPPPLAKPE